MGEKLIRGVGCPACGGSLEILDGTVLVNCKFCGTNLMAKGDRGTQRFYVPIRFTKEQILESARKWLDGIDKAPGLQKDAKFVEAFPVFVPFWRVTAKVVGWVLGDVKKKSGKSTTYVPVERKVSKDNEYTCSACDIGEFGVHHVDLKGDEILPFDLETVQSQGMTFGVLSTPTDIISECDAEFVRKAKQSSGVDRVTFSKLHMLKRHCTIVYYPLWVVRYTYHNRIYQMTLDGESSGVLYGRAPGNNYFRVACLLGSIFFGNLLFTSACRSMFSSKGDGELVVVAGIVAGIVMYWGFHKFRYGGEVRTEQKKQALNLQPAANMQEFGKEIIKTLLKK